MLNMKADKTDIENVLETKCNKMDAETIKDVQSIMCKQFKHILVLFVEVVNCQTSKTQESKFAYE